MRPALYLVALSLLLPLVPIASDFPQDKPQKQDPQNAIEPRSKPGAGQAFLAQMVGQWEVEKVFYPRTGDPVKTHGTCTQRMIHDGRFLQSDFVFKQEQGESTGQGLIGYEEESGIFTSVWTDSRSTRMSLRASKDRFDGKQIVLFSASLAPDAAQQRRSRTQTTLEESGAKLLHRQFSIAQDGKERVVMELLMTRKDATKEPGRAK